MLLKLVKPEHFSALTKFSRVESRFYGRKERGKAAFDIPINPCVRADIEQVQNEKKPFTLG